MHRSVEQKALRHAIERLVTLMVGFAVTAADEGHDPEEVWVKVIAATHEAVDKWFAHYEAVYRQMYAQRTEAVFERSVQDTINGLPTL